MAPMSGPQICVLQPVCCSALQYTLLCCSMLQYVTVCCGSDVASMSGFPPFLSFFLSLSVSLSCTCALCRPHSSFLSCFRTYARTHIIRLSFHLPHLPLLFPLLSFYVVSPSSRFLSRTHIRACLYTQEIFLYGLFLYRDFFFGYVHIHRRLVRRRILRRL